MRLNRRALAREAMLHSLQLRTSRGIDPERPICIYELCEAMGITVHFNDISSMEGMYDRVPKPRIHLSALRPLGRRAFNCAHELAHHVFGHTSTIDELRKEVVTSQYADPKEFLADVFAGFLLMPALGVRSAFAVRGWNPATAPGWQVYTVACHFGVGYATLVNHLIYSLQEIPSSRRAELKKAPQVFRREILGRTTSDRLIVADEHWVSPTLDTEVGTLLVLPRGTEADGDVVIQVQEVPGGRVFRGKKQGIARIRQRGGSWSVIVRVSRYQYIGLARFRHLEDEEGE